jgi:two-component system cell cycle response regulator CtrA
MRVLLIEDDSATAQSIELMLQSEGFNVYKTDLGEEGVDLGKIYDYDIILLDLNLPDMSGIEVCERLRGDARFGDTKIVMLTAAAQQTDVARGLAAGADEYLTKPFSPVRLLTIVEAMLPQVSVWMPR